MLYFRIVVAAAAFAPTVLACFTGIRSIRFVRYHAIVPSIVVVLCLYMNDVNFVVDRKIKIILV